MLTFSGRRHARFSLTMCPAVLKAGSEGTEVAAIYRKVLHGQFCKMRIPMLRSLPPFQKTAVFPVDYFFLSNISGYLLVGEGVGSSWSSVSGKIAASS